MNFPSPTHGQTWLYPYPLAATSLPASDLPTGAGQPISVVRAGYGIFYARLIGYMIDYLWTTNGIYQVADSL